MSLVDRVFRSIPKPLIEQWGIDIVYVKASPHQSYDPESGTVLGIETEIPAKALITEIEPAEQEGLYQQSTVKFLIPASYLGDYYPQTTDSIKYSQNGVTRTAKIIKPKPYRGDGPIMHSVIAMVS